MSDEEPKRLPPGPGRPLGALNCISRDIKEGVISGLLASDYAKDPDNEDAQGSITQYMKTVANKHPELFFSAVVKLIPKELRQHLQQDTQIDIVFNSAAEVKRAMALEGMSARQIAQIESMLPVPLEDDEKEQT